MISVSADSLKPVWVETSSAPSRANTSPCVLECDGAPSLSDAAEENSAHLSRFLLVTKRQTETRPRSANDEARGAEMKRAGCLALRESSLRRAPINAAPLTLSRSSVKMLD